jgi:hypothetical protein
MKKIQKTKKVDALKAKLRIETMEADAPKFPAFQGKNSYCGMVCY